MSVLEMRKIIKTYPRVKALDSVDFDLEPGEIHALLGENGAGKSTLMKVLYGMTRPDSGEIVLRGERVEMKNSAKAIACGIGMAHQHFMLADNLSVLENVIAGAEPKGRFGVDYKAARAQVDAMVERFSFHLDCDVLVEKLSVGEKQRVEIMKLLYRGADILILDEPTAVLAPPEVDSLFDTLRRLRADGKSIIIITHKLYEVCTIADRVTVMRDGCVTARVDKANITTTQLVQAMVGRSIQLDARAPSQGFGKVCFAAKSLGYRENGRPLFEGVDMEIREGEIYGIAGVEGNGQSELLRVVTGLERPTEGELRLDGQPLTGGSHGFIHAGVGHVPEDRHRYAMVGQESIATNLILGYHDLPDYRTRGFYSKHKIDVYADRAIREYSIKTPGAEVLMDELSGGNQQKVVIARVFNQSPKFVVCAQPTRGVDIGATEYIHSMIWKLRDEGKAVLLISADLQEVRKLSDTISVIYKGRLLETRPAQDFDETALGELMAGKAGGQPS